MQALDETTDCANLNAAVCADSPFPQVSEFLHVAGPREFCGATMTERLSLRDHWSTATARPGCLDFMDCKSKGVGC